MVSETFVELRAMFGSVLHNIEIGWPGKATRRENNSSLSKEFSQIRPFKLKNPGYFVVSFI